MENRNPGERKKLVVMGTGLIGCSMAEGLRGIFTGIAGVDNNPGNLEEALQRGWIDRSMSQGQALRDADVVIMSMPVDSVIKLLPGVLDQIGDGSVVIDTGSVKEAVCMSVRNHPKRAQFVAAHPMAGLAVSGPGASDARLFINRKVIICESDLSSNSSLGIASSIFNELGMKVIYMDPRLHDLFVAKVSHLPQVMAYCLSSVTGNDNDNKGPLMSVASTGFESATRLSSSPPDMWIPIFRHNSENIAVSLDQIISGLSVTRDMIARGEWYELEKLIEKANRSREDFLSAYRQV